MNLNKINELQLGDTNTTNTQGIPVITSRDELTAGLIALIIIIVIGVSGSILLFCIKRYSKTIKNSM